MFDACDVRHTPDAPQRSLTLPVRRMTWIGWEAVDVDLSFGKVDQVPRCGRRL
jgi:hypothetical protein